MPADVLRTLAPAKVNLCLHIVGRREDLYHELDSLVVFAGTADVLTLDMSRPLGLTVSGPTAAVSGPSSYNLVLRAARHLIDFYPDLRSGHFELDKRLPVAAGLGGGSSDAAAALRLLATANQLSLTDPRIFEAARRTGADVPVCLDGKIRVMRGVGDLLDAPLDIDCWPAVLVNPRAPVETAAVFKSLGFKPEQSNNGQRLTIDAMQFRSIDSLRVLRNDLQPPAITIAPVISSVLAALERLNGVALTRMSGSGATCFGLFDTLAAAEAGAKRLKQLQPNWWIEATSLGAADCRVFATADEVGEPVLDLR